MIDPDDLARDLVQRAHAEENRPDFDVETELSDVSAMVARSGQQPGVGDSAAGGRDLPPGKSDLPDPYKRNLEQVLGRLNLGKTGKQEELANDKVTASYLAAGMRIIERHMGPGAQRTAARPEDKSAVERPLLSILSQREVAAEVANNPDPFHRIGSDATLRSRWKFQSDFIADLLRFGLWAVHYPASNYERLAHETEEAISGEGFASAIHKICCWDLVGYMDMPMFRLQLVAAASSEGDGVIQEAISERYAETTGRWKIIYKKFLKARGLQPRPGISVDECADLLAAIAEGLTLRRMGDPTAKVVDEDRERSLLGTAVLALIRGCFEPMDKPDGLTLEQAVHEMIRDHERAGARPSDPSVE